MLDNELETFIIFDNKCKLIILSMDWYSYYTKNNKIEITYRQEDEEGWGAGGNEFFTSEDLKGMANCIRSVMNHEKASNHYECWEDTFRIKLKFNEKSKRYSLTVALIETLCKEYHITITKSGLCEKTLMK